MLSKIDLNGCEELQVTSSSISSELHPAVEGSSKSPTLPSLSIPSSSISSISSFSSPLSPPPLNEWIAGYLGTAEIPISESSAVRSYIKRLRSDRRRVHSSLRFIVYKDRIRLLQHRKGSLFAEFDFKDLSFASISPDDPKTFALVISKTPRSGASCHVFSLSSSSSLPLVHLLQSLYTSSSSSSHHNDDSFNTEQLEQLNTATNLRRQSVLKYLPYNINNTNNTTNNTSSSTSSSSSQSASSLRNKEENSKPYNFLECVDTLDGLLPLVKQQTAKSLEDLGPRWMEGGEKTHILKPSDLYPLDTSGLKTSTSHSILRSNGVVDLHAKKSGKKETTFSAGGRVVSNHLVEESAVKNKSQNTRVQSWAEDFEVLLQDTLGLALFSDFLKTEFSHENIAFWKDCEEYRLTQDLSQRKKRAQTILDQYLSSGASDPVNVDSEAKSFTQKFLYQSSPDLFAQAQRQIFNLMKYDSFRRFVQSDVYKDCLDAESSGKELPQPKKEPLANANAILSEENNLSQQTETKKSKNLNYARRKSLLPFSFKNSSSNAQSKSNKETSDSKKSTESAAKASKEESDGVLVRLILPDKATTVVQVRSGESIRSMVARLLEKRGLYFTSFDAFVTNTDKPLNLSADSVSIGSQEVRVEPRNLFRIELPSKKSIGVKAKPTKRIYEVLGPILLQYGWNLSSVIVKLENPHSKLHSDIALNDYVSSIDNTRLLISNRLDEISPKLLEELLIDKSGSY